MKTLCILDSLNSYMDSNEEVAQQIGQIARTYVDFKQNNLHVVSYSMPINMDVSIENLKKHLHFLKEKKNPNKIIFRIL